MDAGAILITGASRGLGAALAKRYASPGRHLILTARSIESLSDIAAFCRSKRADVTVLALDLVDPDNVEAFQQARRALPLTGAGLSLVIANAGIFDGRSSAKNLETVDGQVRQINVNLTANIALLTPIAEEMKQQGHGHLAVVSSLAARQPQPDSPAYSASKAGLSAWAQAMGDDLIDAGLYVTDIQPGHIQTAQTDGHRGALPGLVTADKAAEIIQRGLARKKRRISFPLSIALLVWLGNLLPTPLRRLALKPYRYTIAQPIAGTEVESRER
ncbi:SDR family NAD(P)-dependent oxidoreductase [Cohaesibacter sp. CAU 1516]|uniref:SDR family NAD(P)-dependent oxidoreductase n=1 Tax=Cohaesibacter sp. CAU 1516 TaxID=2576038 RepID=UPI0010FECBCC|nr:SDR family NAD(P)-dependent oxidoreductase [Cohaesibacter sp. CAU 1516]TLP42392.1 SDR family NAD(P)-dependent oxidoreductase [Cohaesibacter sp. CAU 1516]